MKLEDIRPAINNSVLTLYRIFAIVSLYAVLAGVLAFGVGSAFYAVSKSWVAPIILSQADKDTLELTGKTLATQNTIDDLKLDIGKLQDTITEAKSHKVKLEKLLPAINEAIAQEDRHKLETGPVLANLDEQKTADVTSTQRALAKLADVNAGIDKELEAGLITKTDATQATLVFVKSNNDLTDSKIATTLLKDTIWGKTLASTSYLDTLHKKAELESEIGTLGIVIDTAQQQIATERDQVVKLEQALRAVTQTPLWAAMQGVRTNVALVPYDNQAVAKEGAAIYDCYLSFVVCHRVGTLQKLFIGEQHATHPIFRNDIRGFLVQLQLSDLDSAKSKTLFVGSKPFLF
jgi:Tfp pilus assembly major pilin PilA